MGVSLGEIDKLNLCLNVLLSNCLILKLYECMRVKLSNSYLIVELCNCLVSNRLILSVMNRSLTYISFNVMA